MYILKPFAASEEDSLGVISKYPLATLISTDESGEFSATSLPLIWRRDGSALKLYGHYAKRNPQWQHFRDRTKVLAVFTGPQAYITPTWYVSGRDVPTWNYVSVQVTGSVRLIQDFDGLCMILKEMTDDLERTKPKPWEFELPSDLLTPAALENAIVGFEIAVTKLEGKFKLGQARPLADQQSVFANLSEQPDSVEMVRLMRERLKL